MHGFTWYQICRPALTSGVSGLMKQNLRQVSQTAALLVFPFSWYGPRNPMSARIGSATSPGMTIYILYCMYGKDQDVILSFEFDIYN